MNSHWTFKMPRSVPPFSVMLDNLGNPPADMMAKRLGVSVGTMRRYIKSDNPPLTVLLAVYWLTTWGHSEVDCEAVNTSRLHVGLYECAVREIRTLQTRIAYLERVGHFGCANAVLFASSENHWKSLQEHKS
jgi:hypothetical protein